MQSTWSGGILVSRETASLSLETVLLRGTATPILIQWEYLPWYTTVTYRGLGGTETHTQEMFNLEHEVNSKDSWTCSAFLFLRFFSSWPFIKFIQKVTSSHHQSFYIMNLCQLKCHPHKAITGSHRLSSGLCVEPLPFPTAYIWLLIYPSRPGCHIINFANDTTVVGCITNRDESSYRQEVEHLELLCKKNNLIINGKKTNEMIMDFRKARHEHRGTHTHRGIWNGSGLQLQVP